MLGEISVDGGLQVGDRAEDAAADALAGHFGKEVLDRVEPRGRGRGEVEGPARMARQPGQHFGMFVSGVVGRAPCGSACRLGPRARQY